MKKIVFKEMAWKNFPKEPLQDELDDLKKLRTLLPAKYAGISDAELLRAWRDFSDEFYCAGFLVVDEPAVREFIDVTDVMEEL